MKRAIAIILVCLMICVSALAESDRGGKGGKGGGMVKAVASGEGRILSVTINPDVVDPEDVDLLQDMILAAVNDALTRIAEESARRMDAVTGGMKIPGMR